MGRTPAQQLSLVAAVGFGAAPLAFGLLRVATGGDARFAWMALLASIFAGSVMAAAVGRRRSRQAVMFQSGVIGVVGALLAAGAAFVLRATEAPGVWMVSVAFGISLAAASVFTALSRPDQPA